MSQFIGHHMVTRQVIRELKHIVAWALKLCNKGPNITKTLLCGLGCDGVLNTEDNVGAGAAAGGLLEEVSTLQRRCPSSYSMVSGPPCFTVVVCLAVAFGV